MESPANSPDGSAHEQTAQLPETLLSPRVREAVKIEPAERNDSQKKLVRLRYFG